MTSTPTLRPPLKPTSKAASTAQSSQLLAVASQTPAGSRRPSPNRQSRPVRQEPVDDDFLSEKTTLSLIRRVLVADGTDSRITPQPIDAILPPLTSSNEVDVELYAIIAIVFKDFVNTWYTKITSDHAFVDEIIQIIAHCSRAIEQRLRHIDVIELALDEIPALVQQHVEAYRAANEAHVILAYDKPAQIYHTLRPVPALDADLPEDKGRSLQGQYRQLLVQGVLASLLPTEDLQNSPLRILVTDVIADLILGRIIDDRLCRGWFLHEAVSKVVATIKARTQPKVTGAEMQADARSRLEKFGLLTSESEHSIDNSLGDRQSALRAWFWMVLQWFYLASLAVRLTIAGLMHARRLPPRHAPALPTTVSALGKRSSPKRNDPSSHLILNYRIFAAVSTLLTLSRRMPWLEGSLCFVQHFLTSATVRHSIQDSLLDKFFYNVLETGVFVPSLIPLTLRNVRAAMFPSNKMGPPAPPPPGEEEQLQIRRKAAEDLLSLVPMPVLRIFLSTDNREQMLDEVEEDILDPFGDESMNKHLIYSILELVVLRLVPEMADKTPSELLAERGVVAGTDEKDTIND